MQKNNSPDDKRMSVAESEFSLNNAQLQPIDEIKKMY